MHGPQVGVCRVCGEMTGAYSNATCMQCGFPYHLALRTDVPAKDCGQVWINEESQTLDFACDICLGRVVASDAQQEPGERSAYTRREGRRAADVLREKRAQRRRRQG